MGDKLAGSLLELVAHATSADALEAQRIILRRIALQGDIVPSRVPAPRNITEIGGYLNLLESLGQTDMEMQTLAGILGVAGSNTPQGLVSAPPPFTLAPFPNDRPTGPAQHTLPVMVTVRSDFTPAVASALATLHATGCLVPFVAGPANLPLSGLAAATRPDPMPYLGRTLTLAASFALVDPHSDVLLLARPDGNTGPYRAAAVASGPGASSVSPVNSQALLCTSSACSPVPVAGARLVYLAPLLAAAGFYPQDPLPQPASSSDVRWASFRNTTGLVIGQTRLGDELALLYSWDTIHASVYADVLGWIWNGATFASPDAANATSGGGPAGGTGGGPGGGPSGGPGGGPGGGPSGGPAGGPGGGPTPSPPAGPADSP